MPVSSRLLTEREASARLACSVGLLRKWRGNGEGPSFHRIGRLVRYSEASLNSWLEEHRVETSNGGE
jgi:excisionase family DNA binding protein